MVRKCFLGQFVPDKPQTVSLEVASGWSDSLLGTSPSQSSHIPHSWLCFSSSLGAQKNFPPRETASLCCTWGAAPALPSSTHILPANLNCPLQSHPSSVLLSYRRQLGPALGALCHSSHEALILAPFLSLGAAGECLLNYNGGKPLMFRTGGGGRVFHHTALANCISGQTLLNWIQPSKENV